MGADILLHQGGLRLLSPAADSMHPDSSFLRELNAAPLPEDVHYHAIISDTSEFLPGLANHLLGFRHGGDGAVSVESQSLRSAGIPNFARLHYDEAVIDSRHLESPTRASAKIIEILKGPGN